MVEKIAVIIVFSYYKSKRSITGTIYDLNRIVNHCVAAEFDQIRILTDFTSEMIDSDEFWVQRTLFNEIQNKVHQNHLYENVSSVRMILRDLHPGERRFIYYSGHCKNNIIKLPSYGEIKINQLKIIASRNASSVFFIIDCCQSEGVNLLYKINTDSIISNVLLHGVGNTNSYSRYYQLNNSDDENYRDCEIISISSSNTHKNSYSTDQGSIFTYMLVKLFKEYINIFEQDKSSIITLERFTVDIEEQIRLYYSQKHRPCPSIQISRLTTNSIPRWMCIKQNILSIKCDPIRQVLVIERHK